MARSRRRRGKSRAKDAPAKDDKKKYIYGNFPGYYGYRNKALDLMQDPRIVVMDKSWFEDRKVLDIGCNSGQLTLALGVCLYACGCVCAPERAHVQRSSLRRVAWSASTLTIRWFVVLGG